MRALKFANLGTSAVIQAADCMTMCMCFAFNLEDDAVRLFVLTAEYPTTLKQPLKIGGHADTQSLRIRVST